MQQLVQLILVVVEEEEQSLPRNGMEELEVRE
jgi:hypothetical protein